MAVIQSRSEALTGIIGARRAWTVSMISPLSMPWSEVIGATVGNCFWLVFAVFAGSGRGTFAPFCAPVAP
jgi:hypothetical protein